MSPVALITGTSSGIGLSTAVAAAKHGFTTVATMRNTSKDGALRAAAEEAGVSTSTSAALDVVDEASITSCIDGVVADHGSLDILVNNAGRGFVGTIEQVSMAEMREVMEVNFFGVVAATKAAMPHLRAARGRVITVTSVGGVVGQPFNEAYCAAKFAVEGFMESLAPVAGHRRRPWSRSSSPGPVDHRVRQQRRRRRRPTLRRRPASTTPAMHGYLRHIMAEFADPHAAQTGDEVAEVVLGRHGHRLARLPAPDVAVGADVRRLQAERPQRLGRRRHDIGLAEVTRSTDRSTPDPVPG